MKYIVLHRNSPNGIWAHSRNVERERAEEIEQYLIFNAGSFIETLIVPVAQLLTVLTAQNWSIER